MKVTIEGSGSLKKYVGEHHQTVDLQDNAVVGNLLPIIDEKWGSVFPPYIWNSKKQKFRGPVIFVVNDKSTRKMNLKLKEGDHILLVKALVGG